MTILFEVAGPFRLKPKIERIGAMTRGIWLWFSFACIRAGFNDLLCAFECEGWDRCANGEPRPAFPYNAALSGGEAVRSKGIVGNLDSGGNGNG